MITLKHSTPCFEITASDIGICDRRLEKWMKSYLIIIDDGDDTYLPPVSLQGRWPLTSGPGSRRPAARQNKDNLDPQGVGLHIALVVLC